MASKTTSGSKITWNMAVIVGIVAALTVITAILYANRGVPDQSATPGAPRNETPTISTPSNTEVNPDSRIVVAISIDGLNPDAFDMVSAESAPNITKVLTQGATTLNARTSSQSTETLPNHAGMLTGREVTGQQGHGVKRNRDNGKTIANDAKQYVPSIFDVAHDHGLRTAFFAEKDKFAFFARSWDKKNGAADSIGEDNGRSKIDTSRIASAKTITDEAKEAINAQETDLIFLHLSGTDKAGHKYGWLSHEYLNAFLEIDGLLGTLLDAAEESERPVSFLITSDHGGAPDKENHKKTELLANNRIPFIAYGGGVAQGADLYLLNPKRENPQTEVAHDPAVPVIRNMDVANTALTLLGLPSLSKTASAEWPALVLD